MELDRRKQLEDEQNQIIPNIISRNSSAGNVRDLIMDTLAVANRPPINQNGLYNFVSNIGIIFGFAAFAYAVKYILLNMMYE